MLNGHKRHVLHGDCADRLVITARIAGDQRDRGGISLFIVDAHAPNVSRRGYLMQDRLRAAEIGLDNMRVGNDCLIGEPGGALPLIERVVDFAIAALCAEAVGVMDRATGNCRGLSQDAQAIRNDDRHVPGASTSRRRHGDEC